jgi:uroporphyrinogen III methyltransferase/synthase
VADPSNSPLRQKTIFVARAREEAAELCGELESRGAQVLAAPLLRFALPEDLVPADSVLKTLGEFDWWLITSQHAVEFAALRTHALGISLAKATRGIRVGVVGTATEKAAREAGIAVEYVARHQSAAGLAAELGAQVAGRRVLLLRSNLADASLPVLLASRRAEVTDVVSYRTLPPDEDEKKRLAAIAWESVNAAVLFSPSSIRHLAETIGADKMKQVCTSALAVAVGPTTAEAARRQGFDRCVQAEDPSPGAIANALQEWFAHRQSQKMTGANPG